MKKNEIEINGLYTAKVSGKVVKVRIDSVNTHGGWNATNTGTGKRIRIKSGQRLRKAVAGRAAPDVTPTVEIVTGQPLPGAAKRAAKAKKGEKADGQAKPKRTSALDAAAEVLKNIGQPMRAQEMIAEMAEQGLWTSPGGKTPHSTLYAAIVREIRDKGEASRFRKTERGLFEFNAA